MIGMILEGNDQHIHAPQKRGHVPIADLAIHRYVAETGQGVGDIFAAHIAAEVELEVWLPHGHLPHQIGIEPFRDGADIPDPDHLAVRCRHRLQFQLERRMVLPEYPLIRGVVARKVLDVHRIANQPGRLNVLEFLVQST